MEDHIRAFLGGSEVDQDMLILDAFSVLQQQNSEQTRTMQF